MSGLRPSGLEGGRWSYESMLNIIISYTDSKQPNCKIGGNYAYFICNRLGAFGLRLGLYLADFLVQTSIGKRGVDHVCLSSADFYPHCNGNSVYMFIF